MAILDPPKSLLVYSEKRPNPPTISKGEFRHLGQKTAPPDRKTAPPGPPQKPRFWGVPGGCPQNQVLLFGPFSSRKTAQKPLKSQKRPKNTCFWGFEGIHRGATPGRGVSPAPGGGWRGVRTPPGTPKTHQRDRTVPCLDPFGGPPESLRDINILGVRATERSYRGREPKWKGDRVLASGLPSKANPPRPTDGVERPLYAEKPHP